MLFIKKEWVNVFYLYKKKELNITTDTDLLTRKPREPGNTDFNELCTYVEEINRWI